MAAGWGSAIVLGLFLVVTVGEYRVIIRASLSEPHINVLNASVVCMYVCMYVLGLGRLID